MEVSECETGNANSNSLDKNVNCHSTKRDCKTNNILDTKKCAELYGKCNSNSSLSHKQEETNETNEERENEFYTSDGQENIKAFRKIEAYGYNTRVVDSNALIETSEKEHVKSKESKTNLRKKEESSTIETDYHNNDSDDNEPSLENKESAHRNFVLTKKVGGTQINRTKRISFIPPPSAATSIITPSVTTSKTITNVDEHKPYNINVTSIEKEIESEQSRENDIQASPSDTIYMRTNACESNVGRKSTRDKEKDTARIAGKKQAIEGNYSEDSYWLKAFTSQYCNYDEDLYLENSIYTNWLSERWKESKEKYDFEHNRQTYLENNVNANEINKYISYADGLLPRVHEFTAKEVNNRSSPEETQTVQIEENINEKEENEEVYKLANEADVFAKLDNTLQEDNFRMIQEICRNASDYICEVEEWSFGGAPLLSHENAKESLKQILFGQVGTVRDENYNAIQCPTVVSKENQKIELDNYVINNAMKQKSLNSFMIDVCSIWQLRNKVCNRTNKNQRVTLADVLKNKESNFYT